MADYGFEDIEGKHGRGRPARASSKATAAKESLPT